MAPNTLLHNFRGQGTADHQSYVAGIANFFAKDMPLAIAHDTRMVSSNAAYLTSHGHSAEQAWLGACTTPVAALWARAHQDYVLAVFTASHTGDLDTLGLKLYHQGGLPISVGEEDDLRNNKMHHMRKMSANLGGGSFTKDAWALYRETLHAQLGKAIYQTTLHVRKPWYKRFLELDLPFAIRPDGFSDPQRCATPALNGNHLFLDEDGDQFVSYFDGRRISGQVALLAWAERDDESIVVSIDAHSRLRDTLLQEGRAIVVTRVGDQYIARALQENGYHCGGEPNGHLIDSSLSFAPDGLLGGLWLHSRLPRLEFALPPSRRLILASSVKLAGRISRSPFSYLEDFDIWELVDGDARYLIRFSRFEPSVVVNLESNANIEELSSILDMSLFQIACIDEMRTI